MENKGLLFIPDISGFIRFVTEMEIEHSRYIIQELLEVLIDSNELGLKVSEIEGDAILFYKFGNPPATAERILIRSNNNPYTHKALLNVRLQLTFIPNHLKDFLN